LANTPAKLKIGYLSGLASDGHLQTGLALGSWKKIVLEIETVPFITGLEAYQALAGGSVDLVTTGAVISNFPARGQGRAFLINAYETDTVQIWAQEGSGIKTVADLKGRKIATTRGTTAHFVLHRALARAGLDSARDVEIVHQRITEAVTSFVGGAVPAVAAWIPVASVIGRQLPKAVKIASAGQYPDAAILNGWSARNELLEKNPALLRRFVQGWLPANELLVKSPDKAIDLIKDAYKNSTVAELKEQYLASRWHTAADWRRLYREGAVTRVLNAVTQFNVEVGAFKDPLPAEQYFAPQPFLDSVKA